MVFHNYLFLFFSWYGIIFPVVYFSFFDKIIVLSVIGSLLSVYTCYVEAKLLYFGEKSASCDLNNKYMCSKVITSKYSKLFFNVPNCVFGCIMYPLILFMYVYNYDYYHILINISWVMSLVLSYLLLFELKHSCLLCTGIHVTNFLLVFYYNPPFLLITFLLSLIISDKSYTEVKEFLYNCVALTYKEMCKMYLKKMVDKYTNLINSIKQPFNIK